MAIDLSGPLSVAIDSKLAEADGKKANGDIDGASRLYRESAALMRQYAKETPFPKIKKQRQHLALVYEERASGLLPEVEPLSESPLKISEKTMLREEVTRLIHRSSVTWEDIGGLEETEEEIKIAYGIEIARKPKGVKLKGWRKILLYGPPGTGKTLLAAATSNSLEATFFNVALGNILSKYFGESSKLISVLYSEARRLAPSVVYFDEIDALCLQRSGDETGAERRVLSSLLAELDGLANKSDTRYVLTFAATNLPWLLDKAILSRFEKKILVPLPDEKARESILRIHLERQGFDLDASYQELAAMTLGYSGRELERISQEVVSKMIKELNPQLPKIVDRGFDAVQSYELKLRPITKYDFQAALAHVIPEVSQPDWRRFAEWQNCLSQ